MFGGLTLKFYHEKNCLEISFLVLALKKFFWKCLNLLKVIVKLATKGQGRVSLLSCMLL